MTQLDRDARAVLAAARRALGPSQEQRHRARARIAAAIGAGIGVGLATTATASAGLGAKGAAAGSSVVLAGTLGSTGVSAGGAGAAAGAGVAVAGATVKAAAVGTSLMVAKWVAGGFLVAVTGVTAVVGSRHSSDASRPSRAVPTIASHAPQATHLPTLASAARSGVVAATEPPATKAFGEAPAAGRGPPRTDGLPQLAIAEELEVVREADAALRAGRPGRTLELLQRAERRFAGGELAEEREALAIVAQCEINRGSGAAHARRFMRAKPRSVHVETIVDACHLGEPSAQPAPEAPESTQPSVAPSGGQGRFDDIDMP